MNALPGQAVALISNRPWPACRSTSAAHVATRVIPNRLRPADRGSAAVADTTKLVEGGCAAAKPKGGPDTESSPPLSAIWVVVRSVLSVVDPGRLVGVIGVVRRRATVALRTSRGVNTVLAVDTINLVDGSAFGWVVGIGGVVGVG